MDFIENLQLTIEDFVLHNNRLCEWNVSDII